MKIIKLFLGTAILSVSFLGAVVLAQTQSPVSDFDINSPKPEISINKDGEISIIGAKVIQFAGSTIYTRVTWENSFIRLLVKTGQSTNITRRFGESIKISNIAVGDYLSIDGVLESSADSLSIMASSLKDLSDQTQQNNFSGTITAIDSSLQSFTLNAKNIGSIRVNLNTSTSITLGTRIVDVGHLKVGSKITSITGVYNYADKSFQAQGIVVYIDMGIFKAKNFSGILKAAPGKNLPTTMVVTIKSTDYLVKLSENTQVINNKRKAVALSRFVEGDSIVFYGAIQENDNPIIDNVEIVRNASL